VREVRKGGPGLKLTFDIETQNTFDEVENGCEGLLVSVVGIHRDDTDEYFWLRESELAQLENLMIDAEFTIGFNIRKFDLPVLRKYFTNDPLDLPFLDLFEEPFQKFGHRVALNGFAQGTLGTEKLGDGLHAVDLWANGKIDELSAYCLGDVKITRDIYDFGCKNKVLTYQNRNGSQKQVEVSWSEFNPPRFREAQYSLLGGVK
jgi:DEAD/DEAH box helicase domain-containing protein